MKCTVARDKDLGKLSKACPSEIQQLRIAVQATSEADPDLIIAVCLKRKLPRKVPYASVKRSETLLSLVALHR